MSDLPEHKVETAAKAMIAAKPVLMDLFSMSDIKFIARIALKSVRDEVKE